jgi:hypothetical protein
MRENFRSWNVMFLVIVISDLNELNVVIENFATDVLHQVHHSLSRDIVEVPANITAIIQRTESCVVKSFVAPKNKINNIKQHIQAFPIK